MLAHKILAEARQCSRMHGARFCAASKVSHPPRHQTRKLSSQENGLQADLMPPGGANQPELNVTPTESPALGEYPSDRMDRNEPATGAGRDYKWFGAARKW
jgi:hypothetical protein